MKIAVLICSLVFDSQKAFMKGIERRVRDWNDVCSVFSCHVNISGNDAYLKGEYSIFNLPDLSKFDGVIFVKNTFQNPAFADAMAKRILDSKTPCVCIDGYSPDFVNIMSDERNIIREMTSHLISVHNCKKLYFLGGVQDSNDTKLRYMGFRDAISQYNLPFEEEWCHYGNFEYQSGVEAAGYFMNLSTEMPDAIVCGNDEMAVGLITELKRRGIKIPREIKVTGTDYDSISRVFTPRLTTAKRQQYHKGVNAINVLHELSEHTPGETITSPSSLFCTTSCGCQNEAADNNDFSSVNSLVMDKYTSAELTQETQRMTADLMGMRDELSLLDEIKKYALHLQPDELYLCLNVRPDFMIDYSDYSKALTMIDRDNQEDYSDEILSVVAVQGKAVPENFEREYFECSSLFPPIAKGGKPGGTYYFYPIHYMNRNFGYAILGTSGELVRNDFFPSWCTVSGNAMENSRKRSVMEQMIAALDRMWIYDTLTGVYNRAGFFKLSEGIINEAITNKVPVCVVFLDVDGLKIVNDKFGHDEGDVLIKSVANILKEEKRHGEIVMRYGGDEFVYLASNYSDEEADALVEKLEAAMEKETVISQKPYKIEASIGYCITHITYPDELNVLIENADHEMYKNKNQKKLSRRQS